MGKGIRNRLEQVICWFEDLPADYYIEVVAKEQGKWSRNWDEYIVDRKLIKLREIEYFQQRYKEHNLFRSLDVYVDSKGKQSIGKHPIVLDIDYDCDYHQAPNFENLERVRKVTVQAIRVLEKNIRIPKNDIRVVFSGRRGFHIEVRKEFNQASKIRDYLIEKLKEANGQFAHSNYVAQNICIDSMRSHLHVRIKNTWNSWTNALGNIEWRKCFELSIEELQSLNINRIIERATNN
jgi:hypothetical protein